MRLSRYPSSIVKHTESAVGGLLFVIATNVVLDQMAMHFTNADNIPSEASDSCENVIKNIRTHFMHGV